MLLQDVHSQNHDIIVIICWEAPVAEGFNHKIMFLLCKFPFLLGHRQGPHLFSPFRFFSATDTAAHASPIIRAGIIDNVIFTRCYGFKQKESPAVFVICSLYERQ